MKNKLVVCNRVDKRCGVCEHSEAHEPTDESFLRTEKEFCTVWAECVLYDPNEIRRVRCTKVKG